MYTLKFRSILFGTLLAFITQSSIYAKKHSSIERAGDVIQITIPVTALLIAFGKDDTQGMKELFYTVAASTAATWALKFAVNSKRQKGGKYSFPSGHTSLAFSGASFLGMRYGMAYGAPAVGAASFVGYSRVYAKRHYWSDILGGALIGGLSGFFFTTSQAEKTSLKHQPSDPYDPAKLPAKTNEIDKKDTLEPLPDVPQSRNSNEIRQNQKS